MKRRPNWYASMCASAYWAEREPQLDRLETHAIGYATETTEFYERVEPRVTFKQTLIDVAREWQASKREAMAWAT